MSELTTSQKIVTFAAIFGVTYLLLDFSKIVLSQAFEILWEAFGIYAGEEEEVFDDNGGEKSE